MGIGEFLKEEVNFNLAELIYQFQHLSISSWLCRLVLVFV
jgi:hypothetical protein